MYRLQKFCLEVRFISLIGQTVFSYRINEITLEEKEGHRHRCRDLVLWMSSTLAMDGGVAFVDLVCNAFARKA